MGKNLKLLCDDLYDINKVVGGRLDLYKELMGMKSSALSQAKIKSQKTGRDKNIIPI